MPLNKETKPFIHLRINTYTLHLQAIALLELVRLWSARPGFNPGYVIPKTQKMALDAAFPYQSAL